MKPRVRLLTPWVGPLPPYAADFFERLGSVGIVDHRLLERPSAADFCRDVGAALDSPCRKGSGYALSDLRPMLAEAFPEAVAGFEWWGWVELDVVLGDLDRLLPPLLESSDAVSFFASAVSGPLFLMRNAPRCNGLFRAGSWREVMASPRYRNFEEVQTDYDGPGGFTRALMDSGLRVRWEARNSRWPGWPEGPNPHGCRLEGGRLLETPTGRELLLYHFNHTKRWPLEKS